jgi:uncharacterized protein YyaL (SSP411 family)
MNALRAHPVLNRTARTELQHDRGSRHPVDPSHRPHLAAAIDWLVRAQDATRSGGFARGYSVAWNPYFGLRGWEPAYPETTGYIIPTFLEAARYLDRPDLTERAIRAADWELEIQLESGAVQAGVIGQERLPAVFNTGQVILGWLAAWQETGAPRFAEGARRAGRFLTESLGADGHWRKGNSQLVRSDSTLYNARVAWALAEAGVALEEPSYLEAARRNLRAVASMQTPNGWFPNCCLNDPVRPLLHTIAYTVRGLIEGGRVLGDPVVSGAGVKAARALVARVREDGWMSGRFDAEWRGAVSWSCLTGCLQMCNNWIRLFLITGAGYWLEPVPRVLAFVKSTQNRDGTDPGLSGGIKGSWPLDGEYGRFEVLNWATKYFVDALIRHDRVVAPAGPAASAGDGAWVVANRLA